MMSKSLQNTANKQALFSLVTVPMQWVEAFCTAKGAEGLGRHTADISIDVLRIFIAWAALHNMAHVEEMKKFANLIVLDLGFGHIRKAGLVGTEVGHQGFHLHARLCFCEDHGLHGNQGRMAGSGQACNRS